MASSASVYGRAQELPKTEELVRRADKRVGQIRLACSEGKIARG